MMNMVNNVFDFFRSIFSWADRNTRKRTANEALAYDPDFVSDSKRLRSHETLFGKEIFVDLANNENDENDDIQILSEYNSSPLRSSTQMSNSRGNKRRSFPASKTNSSRTPQPKNSSYQCTDNNSNMGQLNGKGFPTPNMAADCRYSTLSRTLRLQEKRQYVQKSQLCSWKPEQERSPSVCRMRSDSQPSISRIQVEREETIYRPVKTTEKYREAGSSVPLKVLPTNTLRDTLSSKSVLKKDLVPQIAKRHEDRIKQQLQEAEEWKRRANILSDKNRCVRAATLEEQLQRTLKLCEAVIDDREEPEEEPLPTLTDEMLVEVRSALAPRSSNEVLVEKFGLRVTRKDIQTLAGLNWLNDEVINFYVNLIMERGKGDKFPKVYSMNTFFYPKLLSGGHSSLKRWTRKADIFSMDIVVVPIHLGIHWCMSIIDFRDKTIRYFDSMGSANPKCLVALRRYLEDESLDKKKKTYDTNDWKLESVQDIPQQMNGSDCGVFSCMFAEFICANRKITFTQQDMPYFRNKMVYEILKARLL
ncbi:sentrin-specific protease 1-like isoform X2 [Belonocnema kinseyi]|uniref:sentrin-specific protease 1-like isoform X2 n=1 Tax=Belonocnema kinseyi TaxID=2817044 RepID=UPI00143D70A4|nr:sentrin-specific protease 1-like isoform X2 [Belonocnema kinseyi]